MKKFWEVKQSTIANQADIYIYGEIVSYKWDDTDTTASSFQKDLRELGNIEQINLHVNSPGGSVFEGIAIGNMLKQHKATVVAHVDALAASIASVIIASCDKVIMPENSMLMIHNPWTGLYGNAKELRKAADDLEKMGEASVITYLSKAGDKLSEERIKQIMDEETWLSAKESFDIGLCDEVTESVKIAASINDKFIQKYQNVPTEYKQATEKPSDENIITEERKRLAEASQNNLNLIKMEMENL